MQARLVTALAIGLSFGTFAFAQTPAAKPVTMKDMGAHLAANPPKQVPPATEPRVPLGSTGSAETENWMEMFGHRVVRNVTQPALYPVRRAPGKANGTAVIIAPGGAFLSLAFDTEGMMVANYLAERGVTSFVLKYRVEPPPKATGEFLQFVGKRMSGGKPRRTHIDFNESKGIPLAQDLQRRCRSADVRQRWPA